MESAIWVEFTPTAASVGYPAPQFSCPAMPTSITHASFLGGQKRKSIEIEVPGDFFSISTDATPIWPSTKNLWFHTAKTHHKTMTPSAVA